MTLVHFRVAHRVELALVSDKMVTSCEGLAAKVAGEPDAKVDVLLVVLDFVFSVEAFATVLTLDPTLLLMHGFHVFDIAFLQFKAFLAEFTGEWFGCLFYIFPIAMHRKNVSFEISFAAYHFTAKFTLDSALFFMHSFDMSGVSFLGGELHLTYLTDEFFVGRR